MPKRSTVDALPRELKEWLDDELVKRGFSDYVALAIDLKAKGAAISKSSLHRYGSKFEERMAQLKASTEQARAIVAASPDNEGAMSEALVRLTQEKMFAILMDLEIDPKKIDLTKFSRSVADMTRSAVSQKRWAAEARAEARRELLEEQRAKLEAMPNKGGVTPDTKAAIREALGNV